MKYLYRLTQHFDHRTSAGILSVLSAGRRVMSVVVDRSVVFSGRHFFRIASDLTRASVEMNPNQDIENGYYCDRNYEKHQGCDFEAVDEEHLLNRTLSRL